jgi:hypothetical protein
MATAVQVESLWNGLTDNSGQPLGAGKVYTYSAGTSTPVSLFTASDKSTSATNPLILDANGKAQVWADGRYKFVVKTSADVTLYTLDNLLYGFDDTTVLYGGTSIGSANTQVVSVPATVTSYANGQTISFVAGFTNTGATTLQFNSLSAISLVKGPTPSSLQAGDLIAGQLYTATYHGGAFRLADYPSVADVQQSRFALAGSVAGTNTITANLSPAPSAYETGQVVRFKAANSTTGATTLNLNSLGPKAVQFNNAALVSGEIGQNLYHEAVYDGTQFQLLNPAMSASTRTLPASVGQVQDGDYIWLGTTGGTATAQTANSAPAITAYKAGQKFRMKIGAGLGSTGSTATAHTLQMNGIAGPKNIINNEDGTNPTLGTWVAGAILEVVYDGTNFIIINDPGGWLSWTPTVTGTGSMSISGLTIDHAVYRKRGKMVSVQYNMNMTTGGTASTGINMTLPVNSTHTGTGTVVVMASYDISWRAALVQLNSTGVTQYQEISSTVNWGLGAGKYISGNFSYRGV